MAWADSPLYVPTVSMAFVLGLLIGSFCNVMGLRLLSEQDFVTERSECPLCHTPIAWFDNMPVISYLILGAKCRHCHSPISLQYPLIELLTGGLFAITVATFGINWGTPFLLYFMANLVVMIITDWKEKLIFHINSFPLMPAGLLYNLLQLDGGGLTSATAWQPLVVMGGAVTLTGPFLSALAGVVGIFVLFEGMILLSRWLVGTDGFGHGDTFLLMGFAAFMGWELTLLAMLAGFMVQTAVALPLLVVNWVKHRQWKLMGYLGASILTAALPLFILNQPLLAPMTALWVAGGLMVVTLVFLALFMKAVRQQEQFTYMPLGPALIVGALFALFCGKGVLASLVGGS
jgi:prepilin signal peptidase PulO-like enzyme (type II secretory pathway)